MMADCRSAATLQVAANTCSRTLTGGFDSYQVEAARLDNPVDDPNKKNMSWQSPYEAKRGYVARDPGVPMAISKPFSTAYKYQRLQKATTRKPYHAFLQCVFQALAQKQFRKVIRLMENKDIGIQNMLFSDANMIEETHNT